MRKTKTEKMVVLSLLAGMAFLLLKLDFFILPTFPWMKLDFSDIPILIGTLIYGPISGIIIAFIRSLLNYVMSGADLGSLIGNTTGFVASVLFLLPIHFFMKKINNIKGLVTGTFISTILLTGFMAVANYFVILPIYLFVLKLNFEMPMSEMIIFGVIPFNLIKGVFVSFIFGVTYKKIIPILEKRMQINSKASLK